MLAAVTGLAMAIIYRRRHRRSRDAYGTRRRGLRRTLSESEISRYGIKRIRDILKSKGGVDENN